MADVETAEKPVLTFDDKDYVIDSLSDTAKYFVTQLQDLTSQEAQAKARLDQVTVAQKGFQDLLREELNKPEEEEVDPDSPVTVED
jgi:enoyl reductase-like protein